MSSKASTVWVVSLAATLAACGVTAESFYARWSEAYCNPPRECVEGDTGGWYGEPCESFMAEIEPGWHDVLDRRGCVIDPAGARACMAALDDVWDDELCGFDVGSLVESCRFAEVHDCEGSDTGGGLAGPLPAF